MHKNKTGYKYAGNLDNTFEKIIDIVKKAGHIILEHNEFLSDKIVAKSGDSNFVTEIDIAVQDYIQKELSKLVPGCIFIMEEARNNPVDIDGLCFVLDPVDGTTNLIHDYRCSAVSLALFDNGNPCFGIIFNPYLNEMFTGHYGKGAYLNGQLIKVSSRKFSDALIGFGTTPYDRHDSIKTFTILNEVFKACREIRRSGSAAVDLANVACGRLDGFFETNLQPWDFAAGKIIVEAGGVVSDFNGNPPGFTPSSIAAGNITVHKELQKMIKLTAM